MVFAQQSMAAFILSERPGGILILPLVVVSDSVLAKLSMKSLLATAGNSKLFVELKASLMLVGLLTSSGVTVRKMVPGANLLATAMTCARSMELVRAQSTCFLLPNVRTGRIILRTSLTS